MNATMKDPRCNQDGCRAMARWMADRKVDDLMAYVGDYCERHAMMATTDRSVYLRPLPAYADVVLYPDGRYAALERQDARR